MRLFNKVAICGVGLIGGSIGLSIKRQKLCRQVIGVSRHKKSLLLAKKMGAIDIGSQTFDIIKDVDFLILATPVKTIIQLAPRISKIIKKGCFVTDVGSSKAEIVSALTKIFPNYIGTHPLAGSQKRGVINSQAEMFKGSICILTPVNNSSKSALKKMRLFWSKLGARTVLLTPATHDKILSFVSHLPHIVAFSLIGIIPRRYLRFASSGFKDTTRIAASESSLWVDIFLSNQKSIISSIDLLQGALSKIKFIIKKNDRNALNRTLQQAKKKRDALD